MKTTVEIADALLRDAKQEARAAGITLRDLIELGLRRELEARKQSSRPFKLRDASYRGPSGVMPGIRYDDGRALRAYAYRAESDALEHVHAALGAPGRKRR